MLIEVLPVQSIVNGTAATSAELEDLRKQNRRQKRAVKTINFRSTRKKEHKFTVSMESFGYLHIKIRGNAWWKF